MLCQREEHEAGRAYPRTCPTCKLGPCQKFGAKSLQSLADAQAEIDRLTDELEDTKAKLRYWSGEYETVLAGRADEIDRAEKAEAERDTARAENERLREILKDCDGKVKADESALHTLWTMGNCRMSFDQFKARILSALQPGDGWAETDLSPASLPQGEVE